MKSPEKQILGADDLKSDHGDGQPHKKTLSQIWKMKSVGRKELKYSTIIFSTGSRVGALIPGEKKPSALANNIPLATEAGHVWRMSRDGSQMLFTSQMGDEDSTFGGIYRTHVFLRRNRSPAQDFLARYKLTHMDNSAGYSRRTPSFVNSASKVLLEEIKIPSSVGEAGDQWLSMYDIEKRKRIFDSRDFMRKLPADKRNSLDNLKLFSPSASPDGNYIVCAASPYGENFNNANIPIKQNAPPLSIILFDIGKKNVQAIIQIDDQWAYSRISEQTVKENGDIYTDSIVHPPRRDFIPEFSWHPKKKRFLFSGPSGDAKPGCNVFSYDMTTKKTIRLTAGTQNGKSPQWSLDGKYLWWLRDGQLFRADSSGRSPRNVFPEFGGLEEIQIVASLKKWNPNIPITTLAGKDK